MKILLTIAATLAPFTSVSAASASEPAGGLGNTSQTTPFFTVVPNSLSRLQILMPGETADAGRPANWGGLGGSTIGSGDAMGNGLGLGTG